MKGKREVNIYAIVKDGLRVGIAGTISTAIKRAKVTPSDRIRIAITSSEHAVVSNGRVILPPSQKGEYLYQSGWLSVDSLVCELGYVITNEVDEEEESESDEDSIQQEAK